MHQFDEPFGDILCQKCLMSHLRKLKVSPSFERKPGLSYVISGTLQISLVLSVVFKVYGARRTATRRMIDRFYSIERRFFNICFLDARVRTRVG